MYHVSAQRLIATEERIERALGSRCLFFDSKADCDAPDIKNVCDREGFTLVSECPTDHEYIHVLTNLDDSNLSSLRRRQLSQAQAVTFVGKGIFNHKGMPLADLLLGFSTLFDGMVVCCTGIKNEPKTNIEMLVSAMGGDNHRNFTHQVTHLLAKHADSEKYRAAIKFQKKVISPRWIYDCFMQGCLLPTADYKISLLGGVILSVTGLSVEERQEVKALVEKHGGVYTPHLTRDCTHLLASSPEGSKYEHALQWGICIVVKDWLYDFIKSDGVAPPNLYTLEPEDMPTQLSASNPTKGPSVGRSQSASEGTEAGRETKVESQSRGADGAVESDLDHIVVDPNSDSYLDGCKIVCVGFPAHHMFRAVNLILAGGGTRFRSLRNDATHIVAPSFEHVNELLLDSAITSNSFSTVNIDWLVDCYRNKQLMPSDDYLLVPTRTAVQAEQSSRQPALTRARSSFDRVPPTLHAVDCQHDAGEHQNNLNTIKSEIDFGDFYSTLGGASSSKFPAAHSTTGAEMPRSHPLVRSLSMPALGASFGKGHLSKDEQISSRDRMLPQTDGSGSGVFAGLVFSCYKLSLRDKVDVTRKIKQNGGLVSQNSAFADDTESFGRASYVVASELTPECVMTYPSNGIEYVSPLWIRTCVKRRKLQKLHK